MGQKGCFHSFIPGIKSSDLSGFDSKQTTGYQLVAESMRPRITSAE